MSSVHLVFLLCFALVAHGIPDKPIWPMGFKAPNTIVAFDEDSQAHVHRSMFYYSYTNATTGKWHGVERHDHFGYCYGWDSLVGQNCTILIIGNVYIVGEHFCCNALPGNYGVPRTWLQPSTYLGQEVIDNVPVHHWYFAEHEYWSMVQPPYDGVRYAGPNFKTPRQFTNYDAWQVGPQADSLFELPKDRDCEKACP